MLGEEGMLEGLGMLGEGRLGGGETQPASQLDKTTSNNSVELSMLIMRFKLISLKPHSNTFVQCGPKTGFQQMAGESTGFCRVFK